jgi:hypothetical protein
MAPTGIEPETLRILPRIWEVLYRNEAIYTLFCNFKQKTLHRYRGAVVITDLSGVNLAELRALRGTGLSDSSNLTVKLGVMLRS